MRLTIRRTTTTGPVKVEDEIYFEDDASVTVQYAMPDSEEEQIESFNLPPDSPEGLIRSAISSNVETRFPLIEALCRQIFTPED